MSQRKKETADTRLLCKRFGHKPLDKISYLALSLHVSTKLYPHYHLSCFIETISSPFVATI
jgi:hypothetical protein